MNKNLSEHECLITTITTSNTTIKQYKQLLHLKSSNWKENSSKKKSVLKSNKF